MKMPRQTEFTKRMPASKFQSLLRYHGSFHISAQVKPGPWKQHAKVLGVEEAIHQNPVAHLAIRDVIISWWKGSMGRTEGLSISSNSQVQSPKSLSLLNNGLEMIMKLMATLSSLLHLQQDKM
jgi:hypothetical protein